MRKGAKERLEDIKSRLLLTLNAIGRKVTAAELSKEAVLNDLSSRQIGQYLKYLHRGKLVRFFPKEHLWAPVKEKMKADVDGAAIASSDAPRVFLMIKPSENAIYLSLAGMKIPILVEE
jgi:hypothetical protein